MLGSCFTDEVGERLAMDGFDVLHNPFGPLYNPLSLAKCVRRCVCREYYTADDLTAGPRGWHCLDYAMRFSGPDAASVLTEVNALIDKVYVFVRSKPLVIITLGSAYVYRYLEKDCIVGNCHKFPANEFEHYLLKPEAAGVALADICGAFAAVGMDEVLFTISPIRHLAYGLHGNSLSKATLQLAVSEVCDSYPGADYFPAYEIMMDDLRDYRFYARDMKHPSDVAIDYIYGVFCETYMRKECRAEALECRRQFKASQHRQIL